MTHGENVFSSDQIRLAKLEGALRLALNVLRDGDASERAAVAEQIKKLCSLEG